MSRNSAASADRAKIGAALAERQFEIFQGSAALAAIREDWKHVTRALDKPRFFHLYEWYESYLNTLSDSPVYFVLARRKGAPVGVTAARRNEVTRFVAAPSSAYVTLRRSADERRVGPHYDARIDHVPATAARDPVGCVVLPKFA